MGICTKKPKVMKWNQYSDLDVLVLICLCFELLLQGELDLLKDDDELLLVHLHFSFCFGDFKELCKRTVIQSFAEGCLSKTTLSGVEIYFLSLLLSVIIWYKQ